MEDELAGGTPVRSFTPVLRRMCRVNLGGELVPLWQGRGDVHEWCPGGDDRPDVLMLTLGEVERAPWSTVS